MPGSVQANAGFAISDGSPRGKSQLCWGRELKHPGHLGANEQEPTGCMCTDIGDVSFLKVANEDHLPWTAVAAREASSNVPDRLDP